MFRVTTVTDKIPYNTDVSIMRNNGPFPYRISYRHPRIDYTAPGSFFVTICCDNRRCLFGEVIDGTMRLNAFGEIVHNEWLRSKTIRLEIEMDEFVVMPNHFHGIVRIVHWPLPDGVTTAPGAHVGAPCQSNAWSTTGAHVGASCQSNAWSATGAHVGAPLRRTARSLGSIIAGFKSTVTMQINAVRGTPRQPVWQSRYHDRLIRTESSLHRIRAYIRNNPLQWHLDKQNPFKKR